ncbi:MAG TPA: GNAT family N-acetyltransferase [Anaerolineales bacterium]|nr:GNAT family N-acetyltransferase [Anaerolineales bacterium]
MADLTLRPAAEDDSSPIKDLIHRVGINPMDLDWHRFVVAVDQSGRMLGCGQLKPHGRDVVELASIAVEPQYRHQGVARLIIEHLVARAPRPLYLTCRSRLEAFYEQWGFRSLEPSEMPPYFRRLSRLAKVMGALMNDRLLVMKLM